MSFGFDMMFKIIPLLYLPIKKPFTIEGKALKGLILLKFLGLYIRFDRSAGTY
jgi:hypothetical protein